MAGVLLVVFAVLLWKTRERVGSPVTITPLAFALLLLAALPLCQWAFGQIHFVGHALLGMTYFLAAALCVAMAQYWEEVKPNAVGDFLFAAILLAALVTSGLMLAQWLQLSGLDVWIQSVGFGSRPFGNLIQPNHAASLLVLGMVSLLWWVHRGKLGVLICFIGASYISVFVAMSGSRIGLLSLSILVVTTSVILWRMRPRGGWWCVVLVQWLLIPLAAVLFSWDWGPGGSNATLGPSGALQRELAGARQEVYTGYLKAVLHHVWLGYGFAQSVHAQAYLGDIGIELPGLFTWAHNAFLDLALWFGALVAIFALVVVVFTVWRLIATAWSTSRWIYMAGVFVIFLHGMVELPLAYLYFLLPIALLSGAAQAGARLPNLKIPRNPITVLLAGTGIYLAVLWYDYLRIEHAFTIWRFKQNNVGTYHPNYVPDTLVLGQFRALLVGLRADEVLDARELTDFREAVEIFPSAAAMQQLAELQVRGGEVEAAQRTANLARLLSLPEERRALARRWQYLGSLDPAYKAVSWEE